MRLIKQTTLALSACLFIASQAIAGEVTLPNTFTANTPAVAAEVNDNFNEVKTAVDDNNARVTDLEGEVNALKKVHVITIPANALAGHVNTTATIITKNYYGLRWQQSFNEVALMSAKSPGDYSGGDVTIRILFRTTSTTAGVVDFFIRPTSYDSGDTVIDPGSLNSTGVSVNALAVYEEVFVVPAARMQKEWWLSSIQRKGSSSTYTDDVDVISVTFEYE